MSDYRNEDDWQIELRRLKADDKYKVCRLNCGFRFTARYVLCCSEPPNNNNSNNNNNELI